MSDHEARMKQGAGQFNFHDEGLSRPRAIATISRPERFRRINQESAFDGCMGSSRIGFSAAKLLRGLGESCLHLSLVSTGATPLFNCTSLPRSDLEKGLKNEMQHYVADSSWQTIVIGW